jgi:hypothetical protein
MTALVIRWSPVTTAVADLPIARDVLTLLQVSPIDVVSAGESILVVPGESFDLPPGGSVSMTVELPRLKTFRAESPVPDGDKAILSLDTDGVLEELADRGVLTEESRALVPRTSRGDLPHRRYEITSVTVDVARGLRRLAPAAASRVARVAALASADSGVAVSGGLPVSLSAKVASRKTPPRYMMLPFVGPAANECRVVPVTPVGAATRLRVEPADPAATLLMDFLLAGKFAQASAAARAIERHRAGADMLDWARPSYCQLLIGYAYALGDDVERLEHWCRRTDAAGSLGTDGLVLAAEAAFQRLDLSGACRTIVRVAQAPPPLLLHGADIGLRIAGLLLADIEQPSGYAKDPIAPQAAGLHEVRSRFTRLLFVADAASSPLSIPTATDPKAALAVSRFRYTVRRILSWLISGWRQRYSVVSDHRKQKRRYVVGESMTVTNAADPAASGQANDAAKTTAGTAGGATAGAGSSTSMKLSGPALWMAIVAVAAWLGFSIFLVAKAGTSDTEWARIAWVFGSIQAIAAAAAGALFGTAVQQQNVSNAQQQATTAKQDADQQRDAATKGRALAAAMQAESPAQPAGAGDGPKAMGPGGAPGAGAEAAGALAERHAQLSRALFGPLI